MQSKAFSSSLFTKDCSKNNKQYFVKAVFDGDTVLIRTGDEANWRKGEPAKGRYGDTKIRLLGIDAFEHDQPPYGQTAKDFLSMLVLNKNVCVETDIGEKDVYGRILGYVFLMNTLINEELLKHGQALLYDFPPNVKYISRLKKAQIYARQNMLGIWEKQDYIPETPSQWRHKHPFKKHLSFPQKQESRK